MKCAQCGTEAKDNQKYCASCGLTLGLDQETHGAPNHEVAQASRPEPLDRNPRTMADMTHFKGVLPRFVAALIDSVLYFAFSAFLASKIGMTTTEAGSSGIEGIFNLQGPGAILTFAVAAVYFVLMEGFLGGTLGKLLLGTRVVNSHGHAPGISAAIIRNLLRIVDFLPFLYILGVLLVLTSKQKQRLGDRLAGTFVVSRASAAALRASGTQVKSAGAVVPVVLLALVLGGAFYLYTAGPNSPTGSLVKDIPGKELISKFELPSSLPAIQPPVTSPSKLSPAPTSGAPLDSKPNLGTASFKAPDPKKLVQSKEWGPIPPNQLGIVLKDNLKRADADAVAKNLSATIVGEFAYINFFQMETSGVTEADLKAAIDRAKAVTGVEFAFPIQQARLDADIRGQRCSPLDDSCYGGENGKPYQMIGVEAAWTMIRASGLDLSEVEVGVTDDGLYKGNDEFGGSDYTTPDAEDTVAGPEKAGGKDVPYANHGTAVTGIIGANAGNGGMSGVASVLGKKLNVQMTNIFGNRYGNNTPSVPDPNDPTKLTSGGRTWVLADLVALKKQIEAGSTIINCSWGNSEASQATAAAYRRFFEKMSRDHPKVLFVVSAGNDGKALDGTKRYPSGLNLPNMITVGCLDNDGTTVDYSNMASPNYEVTLAAPGHKVVSGISADGRISAINGGTSFATPQVTAAAAILRSLNPTLTAADLKRILAETAGTQVTTSGKPVDVDASVGGKVLRVDSAVLKVINDLRKEKGQPPLTKELLEKIGVVDAVAKATKPGEYTIVATIGASGDKGTDVKIELWGSGAISGSTTKHVSGSGDVSWGVSIIDEKSRPTVKVTRLDNNGCVTIDLAPIDMAGVWSGTMTVKDAKVASDITIPDPFDDKKPPTIIKKEDCEAQIKANKGKPRPMKMEFVPSSSEAGQATLVTTNEDGKESPAGTWPYTVSGNRVAIDAAENGGKIQIEGAVTTQDKRDVLDGTIRMTMEERGLVILEILLDFSATKQ